MIKSKHRLHSDYQPTKLPLAPGLRQHAPLRMHQRFGASCSLLACSPPSRFFLLRRAQSQTDDWAECCAPHTHAHTHGMMSVTACTPDHMQAMKSVAACTREHTQLPKLLEAETLHDRLDYLHAPDTTRTNRPLSSHLTLGPHSQCPTPAKAAAVLAAVSVFLQAAPHVIILRKPIPFSS